MNIDECKEVAARKAVSFIEPGMVVGLGTGTTAAFMVRCLGQRVAEGLDVVGVPTSEATMVLAMSLGIKIGTLDDYPELDLAIDGADEVEKGTLNLIKGLGGALLREKFVAQAAKRFIVIVDATKPVNILGERAPVPVEVVQFSAGSTVSRLIKAGARTVTARRTLQGDLFITDNGNYIFDCNFGLIEDPFALVQRLDSTLGVVEHGLFVNMTQDVIIAREEEIIQWSL